MQDESLALRKGTGNLKPFVISTDSTSGHGGAHFLTMISQHLSNLHKKDHCTGFQAPSLYKSLASLFEMPSVCLQDFVNSVGACPLGSGL